MQYFGTDGIRDRANQGNMTAAMTLALGQAFGLWLKNKHPEAEPLDVVLGQDTRVSGDMLASAAAAGIASAGGNVYMTKIMPTPGIAYLVKNNKFYGGVVISASHNPYYDNGLKFFKNDGIKLNDCDEAEIENLLNADLPGMIAQVNQPGIVNLLPGPNKQYSDYLIDIFPKDIFKDMRVILDCANGACSFIVKNIFHTLGVKIITINDTPNGININEKCGSEHPEYLSRAVKNLEADLGFAFDGDGDRIIAVDATGKVLTGDQAIVILTELLLAKGRLQPGDTVVTTSMSNLGLRHAMKRMGLTHIAAAVGDRHVLREMFKSGAVLGGEDSGHIILLDSQTTGDGILSALRLLEAVVYFQKPLAELAQSMTVFPQKLINVNVKRKPELESVPRIREAIKAGEALLEGNGRVLVRYSGTQPICRVMVEGESLELVESVCADIAKVVEKALNSGCAEEIPASGTANDC